MLNSIAHWHGENIEVSLPPPPKKQKTQIIRIVNWGKYTCDKVNDIFLNENWMQSDHIGIITIQE